jgi:stearoyl-CoA desaturase (delta-9 desaturase)
VLKQHEVMRLQHTRYVFFLIGLTALLPFLVGYLVSGSLWGGVCLLMSATLAVVSAQHITWSVNSVTHMWGVSAARSSAKNNYVWLLPMGEGNHHADHHDAPTDYRNGFGRLAWLLDPTRYVILLLRSVRLVGPLKRASRAMELRVIAERKLSALTRKRQRLGLSASLSDLWAHYESSLDEMKRALYERAQRLEALKKEHQTLLAERSQLTKEQLEIALQQLHTQLKRAQHELHFEWRRFQLELKAAHASLSFERLGAS